MDFFHFFLFFGVLCTFNVYTADRLLLKRVAGSGSSGNGGGDYEHYTMPPSKKPTYRPTQKPTFPPPTPKPTARPTYKPPPRPTLRPTNRPTPRPPTKPPTTSWPTPKPTHASCCIPKPEQGQDGYPHGARHHEHHMTCGMLLVRRLTDFERISRIEIL